MIKLQEHDHVFVKRRTLIQPSKKLGRPSKVYFSRVLKFPDYKVSPTPCQFIKTHFLIN